MNFLCEREAAAHRNYVSGTVLDRQNEESTETARYRRLQSRFLQEHLNQWFPQLRSKIQAFAGGPLYRGLAGLTEEYLSRDAAVLLEQIQDQDASGPLEAG